MLVNKYAPNHKQHQQVFYQNLVKRLAQHEDRIIAGDFNGVTYSMNSEKDKMGLGIKHGSIPGILKNG